ncbi:polysaccharide biosynthesis tyrosine autokinase [Rothia koreensis]|jgi:capsular exopolysaccharide synthesis family protein|uniref:polysaccharide biosynthesis tyrosine autokinase n=1 Tax=Rothia koreensis TaxID=592378 RepID=UPI0037C7054B
MGEKNPVLIDGTTSEKSSGLVEAFVRTVRRRWYLLVAGIVVGALVGVGVSALQPRVYAADATGIVTTDNNNSIGLASTTDTLAKSKATQYKSLAISRGVAEDAIKATGYDLSPQQALGMVSVAVPLDTAQIQVTIRSHDPDSARELADAWIKALAANVERVETGGNTAAPEKSQDSEDSEEAQADPANSVLKFIEYVQAETPTSPVSPNVKLNAALGALALLVVVLLVLLLQAFRDRSIRSVEILREVMGNSPLLGTIPLSDALRESRLLPSDSGDATSRRRDFTLIESFKELRTNLQFMNPDRPPRRFVVTSCLPADGKSTVADNLAIALAQGGEPIYLVDADLRRPTVAKSFGLIEDVGLTDVIIGRAEEDDVIQQAHAYPNLFVLAAGHIPPNPSEILASERFSAMIDRLAEKGTVIMDAPPLLPVSDSAILATRFDGALVVVEAGNTTRDQLGKALQNLDQVNAQLLGAVLNKVPTKGSEAGYYRYYGENYYYDESGDGSSGRTKRSRTKRSKRESRKAASGV